MSSRALKWYEAWSAPPLYRPAASMYRRWKKGQAA